MEEQIKYTLGKTERLKSRKTIEQLFANGKSFSLFPFKVVYQKLTDVDKQKTTNGNLQVAFSVSKRNFKKATDRNRIKRLMREAYRLQKNELEKLLQQEKIQLSVFIIYTGNELPPYKTVTEKIAAMIKRLIKITNEKNAI